MMLHIDFTNRSTYREETAVEWTIVARSKNMPHILGVYTGFPSGEHAEQYLRDAMKWTEMSYVLPYSRDISTHFWESPDGTWQAQVSVLRPIEDLKQSHPH